MGNTPEKLSFQIYIKYGILCTNCGREEGLGHHIFAFLGHFLTYFGSHKNTLDCWAGQHLLHILLTFLRHSNFIEEFLQKCQCFDLHLLLFNQLSVRKRSEAFLRRKMRKKSSKLFVICQPVFTPDSLFSILFLTTIIFNKLT